MFVACAPYMASQTCLFHGEFQLGKADFAQKNMLLTHFSGEHFLKQKLIINNCSRRVKIEAHGAHKCHGVASFGVRQVLSAPKMYKSFMVIGSSLWAHGSSKPSGLSGSAVITQFLR